MCELELIKSYLPSKEVMADAGNGEDLAAYNKGMPSAQAEKHSRWDQTQPNTR